MSNQLRKILIKKSSSIGQGPLSPHPPALPHLDGSEKSHQKLVISRSQSKFAGVEGESLQFIPLNQNEESSKPITPIKPTKSLQTITFSNNSEIEASSLQTQIHEFCEQGKLDDLKKLLKETPNAVRQLRNNLYPILTAIRSKQIEIIKYLIMKGGCINFQVRMDAINEAIIIDDWEIFQTLKTDKHIKTMYRFSNGKPIIFQAYEKQSNHILMELCKDKNYVNAKDKSGRTALAYVKEHYKKPESLVEFLNSYGALE